MKLKVFNSRHLQEGWDKRLNRNIPFRQGNGMGNSYAAGTGRGDGNGSGGAAASGDCIANNKSSGRGYGEGNKRHLNNINDYEIEEVKNDTAPNELDAWSSTKLTWTKHGTEWVRKR
jgi:hypothetical protein